MAVDFKNEIWKDIPEYLGKYQVSSFGNIKSLKRKGVLEDKILKNNVDAHGYLNVSLCSNGKQVVKKVHHLVSEVFLNHKFYNYNKIINHINFNKLDNRLENLEITTQRKNSNREHLKSTSKYIGVCWNDWVNKWKSSIRVGDKSIHLGNFENEKEASIIYLKALDLVNSGDNNVKKVGVYSRKLKN